MTNASETPSESEADDEHELNPASPILFLFIILVLGAGTNQLLKVIKTKTGLRLPYSVGLICIGILLGIALYQSLECEDKSSYSCINRIGVGTNGQFQESMLMWMKIPGDLILYIFLPPLIYEGSAYTNVYKFSKHFVSGVVLAVPGVIIQTALIGCTAKYILPYDWNWVEALLFGGILSATDPIAVIALLKELGCLPDLRVLIEAESILNDGTAIVVYQVCYWILTEPGGSPREYVKDAFQLSLGGPGIGIMFCLATMIFLAQIHNPLLETTVTIAAAYLCFFTAQGSIMVSGVLAVMTLGILLSMYGQSVISHEARHFLHVFWGMVEFMANTVIFILAGSIIMFDAFLLKSNIFTAADWGYLFAMYVLLFFIRLVMLIICAPYMRYFGYRLKPKDCSFVDFAKYMFFAAWGGLRGVVGMSLALIVFNDRKIARRVSDPLYPDRVLFHVCGLVALTLLINGPTTEYVIALLGVGGKKEKDEIYMEVQMMSKAKGKIRAHLQDKMINIKEAVRNPVLRFVDWDSVCTLTDAGIPSTTHRENSNRLDHLQEHFTHRLYQLCLEAVKASYEEQFTNHLIGGHAFRTLEFAVNCADDFIQSETALIKDSMVDGAVKNFKMFDVGWVRGFVSDKPARWYSKLIMSCLPKQIHDKLIENETKSTIEMGMAVLEAYQGLHEMFNDGSCTDDTIRQQIADILTSVELRLAQCQMEYPVLSATVASKRIAISLIRESRAEIEHLHNTFQMRDKEREYLSSHYKAMARTVRYENHRFSAPATKQLVRCLPLFKALSDNKFELMWSKISQDTLCFRKGETIQQQTVPHAGIIFIVRGFARVNSTTPDLHGRCEKIVAPGGLEGGLECLIRTAGEQCLSLSKIVAESDAEVILLKNEAFAELAAENPAMLQDMWRTYGRILASDVYPKLFSPLLGQDGTTEALFKFSILRSFTMNSALNAEETYLLIKGRALLQSNHDRESEAKDSAREAAVFSILQPGQKYQFLDTTNQALTLGRTYDDGSPALPTRESLDLKRISVDMLGRVEVQPELKRSNISNAMRTLLSFSRREAKKDSQMSIVDLPI